MPLETQHPELFINPYEGKSACGVAGIADLTGRFSRAVTRSTWEAARRMEHRGGRMMVEEKDGSWREDGDGAGILTNFDKEFVEPHVRPDAHIPHNEVPSVGVLFLPRHTGNGHAPITEYLRQVDEELVRAGLVPLGHRIVPTHPEVLARGVREDAPEVVHFYAGQGEHRFVKDHNRALWLAHQAITRRLESTSSHLASLGPTVVYKALGTASQLTEFYRHDYENPHRASIGIGHRRESTNSTPDWSRVHPYRFLGENGECNSIAAVRNALRGTGILPGSGSSDSQDYDAYIAWLTLHEGLPLEEALRRTVSPAWWERKDVTPKMVEWFTRNREYLGVLSEWEGPKFAVATNGIQIAGVSDRMGYRPAHWALTTDNKLLVASEAGVHRLDPQSLQKTFRSRAGDIIVGDTRTGRVYSPVQIHEELAGNDFVQKLSSYPPAIPVHRLQRADTLEQREQSPISPRILAQFGWTKDDIEYLDEWFKGEKEPRGSMGRDWAPAVLSKNHPPLATYAFPIVANCTNPAPDPELEGSAMDTSVMLGDPEKQGYKLPVGFLTPLQSAAIKRLGDTAVFECDVNEGRDGMPEEKSAGAVLLHRRIGELVQQAVQAVQSGATKIVLSHNSVDGETKFPLSIMMVASALNEELAKLKLKASIVAETPDIRSRHDFAVYAQCGVTAMCPTGIFARARELDVPEQSVLLRLRDAYTRAMALAGMTTAQGYIGAKLLEFVGFGPDIMRYFPGFTSRIGGIDMEDVYDDIVHRKTLAENLDALPPWKEARKLPTKMTRRIIPELARTGNFEYYLKMVEEKEAQGPVQLWDLMEIEPFGPPVPLEEVIPEEEIFGLMCSGAHMSDGALGEPAHRAIARFFNKMADIFQELYAHKYRHLFPKNGYGSATSGGGEGSENPDKRCTGGEWEQDMSRDREIASGRFGLTIFTLADRLVKRLTAKIHQGAKPAEQADMPPLKNDERIALNRFVDAWTRLRSPTTHLDLFSIEAFGELLDLMREINPEAERIVKFVSGTGGDLIGIGVAKGDPDEIFISGGEGGTGSASKEAIRSTGLPREFGLADARRGLFQYGLEGDVSIGVDGGILFADDMLFAHMMGARRMGFGAASEYAMGCLDLRKCHLADGCTPGVNTQKTELLDNFLSVGKESKENKGLPMEERIDIAVGRAENLFLKGICHAMRLRCAELGVRSPLEMFGRTDHLRQKETTDPRLAKIDLSYLLGRQFSAGQTTQRIRRRVERVNTTARNQEILESVQQQIAEGKKQVEVEIDARNGDLAIGTRVASDMVRNPERYRDISITLKVNETAGFGCFAFLHPRMKGVLEGFAGNDFGASSMEGVEIVAVPPKGVATSAVMDGGLGDNAFYGSTGGEAYVRMGAGQRYCVALSGMDVVTEGSVGDYPYQFVRKGTFAHFGGELGKEPFTGMTGGKGFVLDFGQDKMISHPCVKITRGELSAEDEAKLKGMLERHAEKTESSAARAILAKWDFFRTKWAVITADEGVAKSAKGIIHEGQLAEIKPIVAENPLSPESDSVEA